MENINFKHSIIFFNFCILISPLYLMLNFEPVVFCLFLILILGISHGALDNIKGKKLLKLFGYKQNISFYLGYVLISSLIIIFWLIFPSWLMHYVDPNPQESLRISIAFNCDYKPTAGCC